LFVFPSRIRHTRSTRDWSSDVCSSDLLGVVDAAPVGPGQERPPDFDFALVAVVGMKTGRPDDAPVVRVDRQQRTPRGESLAKELAERFLLVPIARGMLLPDRRVFRDAVQGVEIVRVERPQPDERTLQCWLE